MTNAWMSNYDLCRWLGEDVPEAKVFRERYEAKACVFCGGAKQHPCLACAEKYERRDGWDRPHGLACHSCWDERRLKQPEGFEVPDYWPVMRYGQPDRLGAERHCTFHDKPNHIVFFLEDSMCPHCVDEDTEEEDSE